MILPERVFGRSAVNRISSGRAMAPIFFVTCFFKTSAMLGLGLTPSLSVTNAVIAWPLISSGLPTTAASATSE